MSAGGEKLRASVSMTQDLERRIFDDGQRERLDQHLDLSSSRGYRRDTDVLITGWGADPIGIDDLDRMPSLRAVLHSGGTVHGLLPRDAWERGILVTTAAAANALPVAEFTLASILFAGKDVLGIAAAYADDPAIDREGDRFATIGNYRRVVGIIGASQIGRRVIELLRPFDVEVLVADPFLSTDDATALGVTAVDLPSLFRASDIVSIHAPLLPSTVGLVSAELLASLRPGATLINTARGGLVDQDALTAALTSGRISAVLDVTDPEPLPSDHALRGLPNVLLTPHLAGARGNELHRLGESVVREVEALAAGRPPLRPIRLADLDRSA